MVMDNLDRNYFQPPCKALGLASVPGAIKARCLRIYL
jgi:hypothetical protein